MNILGNLLWFFLGGWLAALGWLFFGVLWCITIIGIPVGLQCFKFAQLSLWPFGREVEYSVGTGSILLNIIWVLVTGIPMTIFHLGLGILLCITIIGIPFGLQNFKLAMLTFMPFGARIE